jgi:hypothetical protein
MLVLSSRNYRRKVWVVIVLVALLMAVSLSVLFITRRVASPSLRTQKAVTTKKVAQPKTISSTVLFTGNVYWGRYINDWSMASSLKYAYPFSRLSEFNRDQYDAWISGLECPIKSGVSMTSAEEDSTLTFNCSPDYLPEAAKWFTAFTLANNHTDNQGADGFAETKQHLEDNKIQYFGNPDPTVLDDVCEVIGLPVTVLNDDGSQTKGYLPVAMCGYHGVFRIPSDESVAIMQEYSKYMPVIAMPHMGTEYVTAPDQLKIDFYHKLIDNGADMVLGDHPHVVQNSESYNGHLIVYSMGNFIFDQQDNTEVTRSAAIKMVIKTSDESSLLNKWLTLGETCTKFKDNCLAQAKTQGLTKLNITYQFGVIGTSDANKIVKPATADQQTSILDRLQWQTTISQLRAPFSGL